MTVGPMVSSAQSFAMQNLTFPGLEARCNRKNSMCAACLGTGVLIQMCQIAQVSSIQCFYLIVPKMANFTNKAHNKPN